MKLKALFRFYINASIHVALAVVSLCIFTAKSFDVQINYWLLFFVFFSTILGYNFAKYYPASKLKRDRLPKSYKSIKAISIISIVGLLFSCLFIRSETVLIAMGLSVCNFFYAMPLPHKTLREVPFLKVFIIAFIWTAVTISLPVVESETTLIYDFKLYVEVLERFCWIILLLIPFEIRDYNYDKQHLKTLATVFGVVPLKIVGIALILTLWIIRLSSVGLEHKAAYSLIYLSLILAIVFSKTQQKDYYASFWVEGLPIFWLACLVIAETVNYSS